MPVRDIVDRVNLSYSLPLRDISCACIAKEERKVSDRAIRATDASFANGTACRELRAAFATLLRTKY